MIKYALYLYNEGTKKYVFFQEIGYQAKIIKGETLRLGLKRFSVTEVDHDLDANVIDLYLEEIKT